MANLKLAGALGSLPDPLTWYSVQAVEIQAAIIGAVALVVTFTFAQLVVIIQLGHQSRTALRQSRENEAAKLKLELYRSIVVSRDKAMRSGVTLNAYIQNLVQQISMAKSMQKLRLVHLVPDARASQLLNLSREATDSALEMISVVERWEIIDPRMRVFQDAINAALHDLRIAFSSKYIPASLTVMPMIHLSEGTDLPWVIPNDSQVKDLEAATAQVSEALNTLGAYVDDFQREMQNLLIGPLFDNKIAPRQPLDPSYRAVTLKNSKALSEHFRSATPWGLERAAAEHDVMTRLNMPVSDPTVRRRVSLPLMIKRAFGLAN